MDNLEEMRLAKEESKAALKSSIEVVKRNLKLHAVNKVNYGKALISNYKNTLLESLKKHQENIRAERNDRKEERSNRIIKFKEDKKQKVSSIKSKIGNVKNSFLSKLSVNNIDVKLREFFEKATLAGLNIAANGINAINNAKDKIADFTSTQIANYYLKQEAKQEAKKAAQEEAEKQRQIKEEERLAEQERLIQRKEHKARMKEELRQQRRLKFKNGVNQKVSSIKSKIGNAKNSFLSKLSLNNMDVKLREAFEKVELAGLNIAASGVNAINNAKDKIADFTSTQIANYYLKQEAKKEAKEEEEKQIRLAHSELLVEEEIKERTKDHKAGMKEVIHEVERKEYDEKHIENMNKKSQLLEELKRERQRLSSFYPEIYQEEENTSSKSR